MKATYNKRALLKKLTNISEQCSGKESDAVSFELSHEDEMVYILSEASGIENSDEESTTHD